MLFKAILNGCVILTLFAPLCTALLVSSLFFIKAQLDQLEKITYRLVRLFAVLTLLSSLIALAAFFFTNKNYSLIKFLTFHLTKDLSVSFMLGVDVHTLIFLATSALITATITFYSHRYLHRDPGYRRFFIVISLFAFGIHLIVLAQTFDLIFAGWEIVGLSSFLLIAYFWHRPKAVAAACRAFYIYRVTDLGILATLLITHIFWHNFNMLSDFHDGDIHHLLSQISAPWQWMLSIAILFPVLGKSAQFPFSFWLPKAMEGPTHSSAIFYGSLSIHVGVFLLIKTMPIWSFTPGFSYLLGGIGIITAFTATLFALVQSNIKGQIGYASIAQVGLMLFELALGFKNLAFFHMIGNAFLRCFQLLVSSSILTLHLHMQNVVRTFGGLHAFSLPHLFPKKWRPSLFVFAINDGFCESILKNFVANPTMTIAYACNALLSGQIKNFVSHGMRVSKNFLSPTNISVLRSFSPMLVILVGAAIFDVIFRAHEFIKVFSLVVALIVAFSALGERQQGHRAMVLAIFGNLFAFLSMTTSKPGLLYLVGLLFSSIIALEAYRFIAARRTIINLTEHHGLYQQFPLAGTVLMFGCLGIVSFPVSSTFFGEDILLNLSVRSGLHYLIILQLIFIISGIAIIRFYSMVMFGKRDNAMKEIHLDMSPRGSLLRLLIFSLGNLAAFFLALS